MSANANQDERDDGRWAAARVEPPLVRRDHDAQLLDARMVTTRRPGQWVIVNGDYAKIFDKWGVASTEITKSTLNPAPAF